MQIYGCVDFKSRRTPELGQLAGDAAAYLSEEICAENNPNPVDIDILAPPIDHDPAFYQARFPGRL